MVFSQNIFFGICCVKWWKKEKKKKSHFIISAKQLIAKLTCQNYFFLMRQTNDAPLIVIPVYVLALQDF